METQPKLFMLLVGCTPPGRHTEQHDVYFQIGNNIADLIPGIIEFWPEAKGDIHLDAWREVTNVDGYTVEIKPLNGLSGSTADSGDNRLFFLNLGGYKKDEFEEFHYKMLAVAKEKGEAVRQAKQTAFYKHTGFKGATSHIDDKFGIDVDDVYAIEEILPADSKSNYRIHISKSLAGPEDEMHLGYFTFQKLVLQKKSNNHLAMNLFADTEFFNAGIPKKVVYTLQDADLIYIENFFSKEDADNLYTKLLTDTNWLETKTTVYGKEYDTPRLTAWYGDAGTEYTFSGNKMNPFLWTNDLLFIKEKVNKESGIVFNSVLLNLYRNGKDSVGWHRDDEKEFGTNPVISSVSFGETRPFHLKHKFKKDIEKVIIPLTHGSLLIMKGKTQHYWEHQIPKTAKDIKSRINLTFRIIKNL